MTDEEENEHIETLATTLFPFLSDVQITSLSTLYKRKHTFIVSVCWHINIGTLVTKCTPLRSSVPLKSR